MNIKEKKIVTRQKNRVMIVLKYAILIAFSLACLYPLVWVVLGSFKTNSEIFTNTWGLPEVWQFQNYKHAIVEGSIGRYFLNSVFVTLVSVCITIVLAAMASYGITRLKWKLSKLALGLFSLGLMIPAYGSIIPLFAIFNKTKLLNTYAAVIIPHVTFALPMAVLIMSSFFSSVPKELEEAAAIDGCSLIRSFFIIIFPISISSIVTVSVITLINVWNDLLFPQIFLTETSKMTLPVGLTNFQGIYATDYVGMFAAIVITVIPIIITYILLHEKIIEGMSASAVKG